jgi:hypothetical protein
MIAIIEIIFLVIEIDFERARAVGFGKMAFWGNMGA